MCEPLKGKIITKHEYYQMEDGDHYHYMDEDVECFTKDAVKSAVRGFLKEIDCMNAESDGTLGGSCTIMRCDVEHLVAKWFEDVLE